MMKKIIAIILLMTAGCIAAQKKDSLVQSAIHFQEELNKEYADSLESPLLKEDRLKFKGHDFYPVDMAYCVKAKFIRTPAEKTFRMKTTSDRSPAYVKYGELHFKINNKKCKLNVYQNVDLVKKAGYEDYLFLPFRDLTSGVDTYGGGRYIDLRKTKGNVMIIDFNKSYNPYCAYNHGYSCPVPPVENMLQVEIKAGIKFKD